MATVLLLFCVYTCGFRCMHACMIKVHTMLVYGILYPKEFLTKRALVQNGGLKSPCMILPIGGVYMYTLSMASAFSLTAIRSNNYTPATMYSNRRYTYMMLSSYFHGKGLPGSHISEQLRGLSVDFKCSEI